MVKLVVLLFALLMISPAGRAAEGPRILLLCEVFPKSSGALYAQLKTAIGQAGFALEEVRGAELAGRLAAEQGPGAVLVLPNAPYFPVDAKAGMLGFLARGNHLFCLSGPPFGDLVTRAGEAWLTRKEIKAKLIEVPGTPIVDLAKENMADWPRYSATMQNKTTYEVGPSGDEKVGSALHVEIGKLDDYDIVASRPLVSPFGEGHTVTLFWAKGGPNMPELAVEWREKDGSRWMAVVNLGQEWTRYALTPDDFRYWSDNPSTGRGGTGDRFKPENGRIVTFGLATGISTQEMGIAHEFWVAGLASGRDEYPGDDFSPPILDTISPPYKTYRTFVSSIQISEFENWQLATTVTAPIARSRGLGTSSPRRLRYIPVLRGLDTKGEVRGSVAHMTLNLAGDYAGSVWGYAGLDQDVLEMVAANAVPACIDQLRRLARGAFLANAGSDRFAYANGEEAKLGAYVVNLGSKLASVKVEFRVTSGGKTVHSTSGTADVPARTVREPVFVSGEPFTPPEGEYSVKTTLVVGKEPVDEIAQPLRVIKYGPLGDENTAAARDGDFWLAGKKWYALGVNYWPRNATAREPSDDNSQFLSPSRYDPEIIEQDLALARTLGINLLSTQYNGLDQAPALMDFLARAETYGIKVNLYIPGLHPLYPNFDTANKLITAAHLPETPALFAYDVGWEVTVGKYEARKRFDREWQDWVIDRYGGIEAAQTDWEFKPERVDGVITGPTDDRLANDGAWRIYVAAYRRFWDDEISKRYKTVIENIIKLNSRHLIGARSGYGGTGSMRAVGHFPFDLASGAKHLDFTSPEGYMLTGDRLGFLKGGLDTAYGRLVSAGKPVYWAEFGKSIWPKCGPVQLEEQRQYYEKTFEMIYRSGANGAAGWWWPGGLRIEEESDYGIINPDGTPRPAALEIRKFADRFGQPREVPKPGVMLSADRDSFVTGFAGIFDFLASSYVDALEGGRVPGVKTDGSGTTSADTPLVAVGNRPYNGTNPPKYLNAEFNYLKINGQAAADDAMIEVERDKPVYVEASTGNIGEAAWLAPKGDEKGGVYLVAESAGGKVLGPIAADTPFLGDGLVPRFELAANAAGEAVYTFGMLAKDRASFGEVVRVTVRAK